MKKYLLLVSIILLWSCNDEAPIPTDNDPMEDGPAIYLLPVVVHVLHNGEIIGEGANLSDARIERQIEILNEDFRRKAGTRGENDHPDSDDARIEFVLAKQDPDGNPTTGITRTFADLNAIPEEVIKREVDIMGYFNFWESASYINIWTAPYHEGLAEVHLGSATGPDTDLPGNHLFARPVDGGVEGIVINHWHFGESSLVEKHNLGRTLTHEMGHYLGLLHPWGGSSCEENDFCEDTPAVEGPVTSSTSYAGCEGEEVMIENYMNWTPDEIMNVFTKDQIARMRYVLENSDKRSSLLNSKGLQGP